MGAVKVAQAREANLQAERGMLQKQLEENEGLIRSMTEKLDVVNSQLEEQTNQCKVLSASLDVAEDAAAIASDDCPATSELLERIEALEVLLARASEAERGADAKVQPPATSTGVPPAEVVPGRN